MSRQFSEGARLRRRQFEVIAERWRVPVELRGAVIDAALRDDVATTGAADASGDDAMTTAAALLLRMAITDEVGRAQGDRLWSLAGHLGCPEGEREALLVEVMVQFSRRLADFDPSLGDYGAWLTGFVRNVWRNLRRRVDRGRQPLTRSGVVDDQLAVPPVGARQVEDREALLWLLDQLSPPLREAWVLQEVEGYTQEEIAVILRRPKGTVGRRVDRAKKKLEALVAQHRERWMLPLPLLFASGEGPDEVLRRLIDASRTPRGAPPDLAERLRRSVRERTLRDAGVTVRPSRPPPQRSVGRWIERGAVWAAGAASTWVMLRGAPKPRPSTAPAQEVARVVEPRVEAPTTVSSRHEAEAAAPTPPPPSPVVARAEVRRTQRVGRVRAPYDEREMQWIEQAESAIGRGQLDDARAALAEHAREYPNGALAQERETLRAQLRSQGARVASGGAP